MGENENTVWDSDAACAATRRMWLAVAEKAKNSALETDMPLACIVWAQLADMASWQATGEGDCTTLQGLTKLLMNQRESDQ